MAGLERHVKVAHQSMDVVIPAWQQQQLAAAAVAVSSRGSDLAGTVQCLCRLQISTATAHAVTQG